MMYDCKNALPNHRTADKCCCNCENFYAGYEGDGDCGILLKIEKEKRDSNDNIVYTLTSGYEVCDLWTEITL